MTLRVSWWVISFVQGVCMRSSGAVGNVLVRTVFCCSSGRDSAGSHVQVPRMYDISLPSETLDCWMFLMLFDKAEV